MKDKVGKGKFGEISALNYLKENDFEIISRNYRLKLGELDIIAQKGELLFGIEVKFRTSLDDDFHPLMVMNKTKINRMKRVMETFVTMNPEFSSINNSFCLITVDSKGKVDFYSDLSN